VKRDLMGGVGDEVADIPAKELQVLPPEGIDLDARLGELEKGMLVQALERTGGNRTNAAKLLRMSLRSLRYRLAKYELSDELSSPGGDDADEV
jgi:two-component system, NtrC family, response regulator PilR